MCIRDRFPVGLRRIVGRTGEVRPQAVLAGGQRCQRDVDRRIAGRYLGGSDGRVRHRLRGLLGALDDLGRGRIFRRLEFDLDLGS